LSFVGAAWAEGPLLGLGYAYEQASKLRRAPELRGPLLG
jgi:amidase